jgi:hypothetical protein
MFDLFSNSIIKKSLAKVEWNLKRVSNLIQMIDGYYVGMFEIVVMVAVESVFCLEMHQNEVFFF